MFLIKQVSSDLGITPQAIYKQKEELQSKGYMIKNSSNDWEITSDGYNYLKEKQINRFKRNNISLKENDMKSADFQGKEEKNSLNETLINFYETRLEEIKQSYENQLNEQKKQVEYFKNLYEEEKSERIRTNARPRSVKIITLLCVDVTTIWSMTSSAFMAVADLPLPPRFWAM